MWLRKKLTMLIAFSIQGGRFDVDHLDEAQLSLVSSSLTVGRPHARHLQTAAELIDVSERITELTFQPHHLTFQLEHPGEGTTRGTLRRSVPHCSITVRRNRPVMPLGFEIGLFGSDGGVRSG